MKTMGILDIKQIKISARQDPGATMEGVFPPDGSSVTFPNVLIPVSFNNFKDLTLQFEQL